MASVNKVIVLGRLGKDPELRYTQGGTAVCSMSVATSEKRKDNQGNTQENTEWHRIVVWSKAAENCSKYLAKGREVYIEGRLQTRSWEDNNGQKRYATEIIANQVQFIGSAPQGQQQQQQQRPEFKDNGQFANHNSSPPPQDHGSLDDIPF